MAELIQHVYVDGTLYGPGSDVPDDVAVRITNPKAWKDGELPDPVEEKPKRKRAAKKTAAPAAGSDQGDGGSGDGGDGTGDGAFDPSEHDVDEVNNHLAEADDDEDEDEVTRVIAAETAGKARKGILEGPYAPEADED